jgi:hypothetical protein
MLILIPVERVRVHAIEISFQQHDISLRPDGSTERLQGLKVRHAAWRIADLA